MKRMYILSLLFVCLSISKAQNYVTIPDASFVAYLQTYYPSCMDEDKMDTTCTAIKTATYVSISSNIVDLTGIQYFTSLRYLDCSYNELSTLPLLPHSLLVLLCNNNLFNSLPTLPKSLQYLYCQQNNITSIQTLPSALKGLDCQYNSLKGLPQIPNSLEALFCSNNLLTALPKLPNSLISLSCSNNKLVLLPELPSSLNFLYSNNNQLTDLPALPIHLQELNVSNNSIRCFPQFPNSIKKISIDNNPFTCLPNYIPAMDALTQSYPICLNGDVNNPYNCLQLVSINENAIANKFKIYPNPSNGNYTIAVTEDYKPVRFFIKINNAIGEEIISIDANREIVNIDITSQPTGIYLLKINGTDFSITRRIIKE